MRRRVLGEGGSLLAGLCLLLVCGCRTYESAPIDWAAEDRAWNAAGEIRLATADDAARVALVGNAELNRMRLKLAGSRKVAQATGWWEDPELDFDFLRIVNPSENPFLFGANLAFTIPLSGVPALERQTAEAYSAADAADIVAAENDTAAAARQALVRLAFARQSEAMLKDFDGDGRIARLMATAERLAEAGEIAATDLASAKRRRHERQHRLYRLADETDAAEAELRRLLGLAPSVKIVLAMDVGEMPAPDTNAVWTAMDFVRHPRVRAALARLEGGERALETEIRRQYPDLKIGPAYSQEEGEDRFGFVLGTTLPLWNRNRKGIATAEGDRDAARADAIAAWRAVVSEADAALRKYRRLIAHGPERHPCRETADRLAEAGELKPLDYLAVREELLEAGLAESEWRLGVRLVVEELRKFRMEER